MPDLLRKIRNIMVLRTARIMANRISHYAPGPAPKTIGIGPIIIAPPPLAFPVFLLFDRRRSAVATIMISIPAKAKAVPRL